MKTHDTSATLLTVSELQSVKIAAENIESTIFYKFVINILLRVVRYGLKC